MKNLFPATLFAAVLLAGQAALVVNAVGQTTTGSDSSLGGRTQVVPSQTASLTDYLISQLKATTPDQQDYVRAVVLLVNRGKLERRLVIALERYSTRKNPNFPLPVFERALRVEGKKRGVTVPLIREIVARNGAARAQSARAALRR